MQVHLPSERKFEIYHAVETQHLSRRDAARRFGLSSTRVQQIVDDVKHFLLRYGNEKLLGFDPEHLELASLRICYERLCYFYRTVMRQMGALDMAAAGSPAALRLLNSAAKLSIEQSKVAGRIAKVQQAMIEAGTLVFEQHEYIYEDDDAEAPATPPQRPLVEAPQANAPPAGGCTANGDLPLDREAQAMIDALVNGDPELTSDDFFTAMLTRKATQSAVQTPAQSRRDRKHRGRR